MIIVLMNYIKKYTDGTITVRPEWVPRLNDIGGIADVLREIDKHVRWPNGPEVAVIERRNLRLADPLDQRDHACVNHPEADVGVGALQVSPPVSRMWHQQSSSAMTNSGTNSTLVSQMRLIRGSRAQARRSARPRIDRPWSGRTRCGAYVPGASRRQT
ncbi:hypothetical protein [Actinomadura rudentiformis]|uniref:Uncharacterized protein n=1 Tax=Actinomadura rudentiformis TaxID=359158 RepID=A0A6H9YS63_9ACTN|nr:hypothetical protein [Actinomadura rudentiformis]KAB2343765.1 hypothetical protein F8566_34200 [Actinomadura rudentiformis]